ncbi:thionin-like protein 2 [Benincasa hispida]|uniref:thionin-like protein 2 n=1 Tax=Benincasa hispida TaxID=102211 RepID=UPI0019020F59|nr:thionin-like protein 2 [Benincasa hispida]
MESSMAMKWALMACLLLSSLSIANSEPANSEPFQECYSSCFGVCSLGPSIYIFDCPLRCLHSCIALPSNDNAEFHQPQQQHHQFYCKLGCATSTCTGFGTKEKPAVEEVTSCVDSCAQVCSMN